MPIKRGGYLKPWEASQYLGIPVDKLYEMLEKGEVPGEKIEGHWRVDLAKLEAWLDEEVSEDQLKNLAKNLNVGQDKVQEFFKKAKSNEKQ
jgi:excisionase family DNA binding protein